MISIKLGFIGAQAVSVQVRQRKMVMAAVYSEGVSAPNSPTADSDLRINAARAENVILSEAKNLASAPEARRYFVSLRMTDAERSKVKVSASICVQSLVDRLSA
jgi:hypothetical protein